MMHGRKNIKKNNFGLLQSALVSDKPFAHCQMGLSNVSCAHFRSIRVHLVWIIQNVCNVSYIDVVSGGNIILYYLARPLSFQNMWPK